MYTYKNDRYYLPLTVPEGKTYRLTFGPGDVVLDSDTDVIIGMHYRFDDGSIQDIILLPANRSQTQVLELVADLMADIGARVIHSQIVVGNVVFDKISDVIIDHVVNEGVTILKRWFRQKSGVYYDIRTGKICSTKVLEKYDVEFD